MVKKLLSLLAAITISLAVWADEIALNPDHPDRYVVVKGDTLWDISAMFLHDPWLWPEVWYVNPQIENPHLIYPGDVISLVYVDGKPRLQIRRGPQTIKLSPTARATRIDEAIPTIPVDAIRQFLTQPLVVGEHELDNAPYVVDSPDEHIVTGAGDRVYVRGMDSPEYARYSLFEKGDAFTDPQTGEILGYEAQYLGEARLQRFGDISTMALTRTTREISKGDRLLPILDEEIHTTFLPHPPASPVDGQIISVVDGVSQIGQYQVVVINRGEREGMEVGHVLKIMQRGAKIRDTVSPKRDKITLPDEEAGVLMVFRTFDKVSFALVMKASRAIHVLDRVTTP